MSMSSTENELDGLGICLQKSVGLRCPIWGEEIDPMPFHG